MPDKKKMDKVSTKPKMSALTAKGNETHSMEKDGRMRDARQKKLDKAVAKAGGADAYRKDMKKKKSNMVKYKNKYYNKNTKQGKAIMAKMKK